MVWLGSTLLAIWINCVCVSASTLAIITIPSTNERIVHVDGDPIIVYKDTVMQIEMVEPTDRCGIPSSPTKSPQCRALTEDCRCYNWQYAGPANTDALRAMPSARYKGMVAFMAMENVTAIFDFELGYQWPRVSGQLAAWLQYMPLSTLEELCPRINVGAGEGCVVRHEVPIIIVNSSFYDHHYSRPKEYSYTALVAGIVFIVCCAYFFKEEHAKLD